MLALLLACVEPPRAGRAPPPPTTSTTWTSRPPVTGPAPVEINEWMPATLAAARDEDGNVADWIELVNLGPRDVLLDGWSLTDDPEDPRRHALDGLVVRAGGFRVLWADGVPGRGEAHLPFTLADDGGALGLFAPDGTGTVVTWDATPRDLAIARIPDGCGGEGCLRHGFAGTPGGPNR